MELCHYELGSESNKHGHPELVEGSIISRKVRKVAAKFAKKKFISN